MSSRDAYEIWHAQAGPDLPVARTPWHRLVLAHLDVAHDLAGKRVLEIGCGRGGFLCSLALNAPEPLPSFFGIDYAPNAVAQARALARDQGCAKIDFAVGDIQAIAHPDATFDTVISCETIEHVPDPGAALGELARVLRPGGKLFLTTPNYLGPMGLYRLYLRIRGRRYTEVGQPINHFTMLPRTLIWVKRAGLKVQATDGVGHYLLLPRRAPRRLPSLDRMSVVTRWVALHSIVVAVKPPGAI